MEIAGLCLTVDQKGLIVQLVSISLSKRSSQPTNAGIEGWHMVVASCQLENLQSRQNVYMIEISTSFKKNVLALLYAS